VLLQEYVYIQVCTHVTFVVIQYSM